MPSQDTWERFRKEVSEKVSDVMDAINEKQSKMNRKEERIRLDLRFIVQEKAPTNILKIAPTP